MEDDAIEGGRNRIEQALETWTPNVVLMWVDSCLVILNMMHLTGLTDIITANLERWTLGMANRKEHRSVWRT